MRPLLFALLLLSAGMAACQEGPLNPAQPSGISVDEIVRRFAAKEAEFKLARDQYTFRQAVKVQTIDGDTVTGEYQMVADIVFDDKGRRLEHVVFAPQSSLENGGISMSKEDLDDIQHRLPFVLTTNEIPQYQILYIGQQKLDELDTYVFDIAPKTIEKDHRYFQGRIWVDNQDFQIVKTYGKTVPDIIEKDPKKRAKGKGQQENLFPKFSTYREQIDGKYWFPTYTRADDVLHFSSGDVHIRIIVKYTDYKRFGSSFKIVGVQETPDQQPQQPAKPPK